MTAVVAVFRNPNTGTTIRVTGANIGVVTAWGWTRLDDGPPGTPPDPFPQYLSDTELAAALTAKADLVSGKVPAAQLPPIPATPAAIGAQPAGSYATTVAGTVPDAQLPTRLQDTQLKAAFVAQPTGGTDGQALVKSGSDVVWATVAGGTPADGSITPTKLSFDPATQAELDAVAAAKVSPTTAAGIAAGMALVFGG